MTRTIQLQTMLINGAQVTTSNGFLADFSLTGGTISSDDAANAQLYGEGSTPDKVFCRFTIDACLLHNCAILLGHSNRTC